MWFLTIFFRNANQGRKIPSIFYSRPEMHVYLYRVEKYFDLDNGHAKNVKIKIIKFLAIIFLIFLFFPPKAYWLFPLRSCRLYPPRPTHTHTLKIFLHISPIYRTLASVVCMMIIIIWKFDFFKSNFRFDWNRSWAIRLQVCEKEFVLLRLSKEDHEWIQYKNAKVIRDMC